MGGDEPDSKKVKGSQDIQGMTSKQYLDTQVVPHLLPALNAVSTNRPSDPIQYLVSTSDKFLFSANLIFFSLAGRLFAEKQKQTVG